MDWFDKLELYISLPLRPYKEGADIYLCLSKEGFLATCVDLCNYHQHYQDTEEFHQLSPNLTFLIPPYPCLYPSPGSPLLILGVHNFSLSLLCYLFKNVIKMVSSSVQLLRLVSFNKMPLDVNPDCFVYQ